MFSLSPGAAGRKAKSRAAGPRQTPSLSPSEVEWRAARRDTPDSEGSTMGGGREHRPSLIRPRWFR